MPGQPPRHHRLHGRGDRPGACSAPPGCSSSWRLSGAPGTMLAGHRAGRAPGRSAGRAATSGWTATSPSPAACWRRACSGAVSSPPRPRWCSRASAASFGGFTDDASLAVVAPVTEEATKGAVPAAAPWWRRAELDGILDGIVYAGMVGIGFAFIENILYLAAAYNGTDGTGPGGTDGADGDVRGALPVQPVRAPAFTTFIGIGVGIAVTSRTARRADPRARCWGTSAPWPPTRVWNASTLYGGRRASSLSTSC